MSALLIYLSIAITEIMIGNTDQFIAPDWEYRPWVEVVDDEGAYSVRWLEWDDIDTDGATVLLRDDEGSIIASAYYPAAIARCSWAMRDDGTWSYTSTPTPSAPNSGGWASVRLDAPEPSGGQRFFADSTTVSVTIPEGLTLRYTTDGSAPTLANGNTSPDGRFTLRQTTALRLCFVADGYLPSAVVSQTYVRQDFAHPLPIVSVMSDSLNLWGDTLGIFVEGTNGTTLVLANGTVTANWNADWERPANVELFGADGAEVWNLEAGIKRFGYTSRRYQPCGFKITAKKRYEGLNYLPAQVFSTRPYRRHRSLAMRCGSDYVCRIKDPLIGEILRRSSLNIDVQAYQPVMHYINGHYAGTINLRETSNRHFVFTNYGLDDDEIDFFQMDPYSGYAQSYGTRDAFERWYALAAECGTSDEAYDELCQLVDIDELCNYLATQFYICNNDWPPNNLKAFRPTEDGGRFRFILFDLDAAWNTQYPIGSFLNSRRYAYNAGVRHGEAFVYIVVSVLVPARCLERIT